MEKFEVVFLDDDNETILDKQLVDKGASVKYNGPTPEKDVINGIKYVFAGWTNEEKLENVEENLILVAKYADEDSTHNIEDDLFNATLESTKKMELNATISAGNKLSEQKLALEKDGRTPEEIVEDVIKNGKTELRDQNSKEDIER